MGRKRGCPRSGGRDGGREQGLWPEGRREVCDSLQKNRLLRGSWDSVHWPGWGEDGRPGTASWCPACVPSTCHPLLRAPFPPAGIQAWGSWGKRNRGVALCLSSCCQESVCVCVGGRECPAGTAQVVNLGGQKGVGVAAGMGKEAQVSTHTPRTGGDSSLGLQSWVCHLPPV